MTNRKLSMSGLAFLAPQPTILHLNVVEGGIWGWTQFWWQAHLLFVQTRNNCSTNSFLLFHHKIPFLVSWTCPAKWKQGLAVLSSLANPSSRLVARCSWHGHSVQRLLKCLLYYRATLYIGEFILYGITYDWVKVSHCKIWLWGYTSFQTPAASCAVLRAPPLKLKVPASCQLDERQCYQRKQYDQYK